MPRIIAILPEEKPGDSYIAVELDSSEPEILFMKGPAFTKTMGPYPPQYAEATFNKWGYCMVKNPPEIKLENKKTILDAVVCLIAKESNSG